VVYKVTSEQIILLVPSVFHCQYHSNSVLQSLIIRYLGYTILSTYLKKHITKSLCSDKLFLACEEPEVHFCKLHPVQSFIKLFLYIYVLLGYYVMWFGKKTIKLRSNILPHSSQHKIQQVHKCWYRLAKLRGGVTQTTIMLILTKT
jgi:hypothetical protein